MKTSNIYPLLLALLLAAACSSEIEIKDDNNGLALKEGEQLVQIRLAGMSNVAVPVSRAGDDAPGLDTDPPVLPALPADTIAENLIDELTVYGFVGINPEGTAYTPSSAGSIGREIFEFTLERVYHYKKGSDNNDMLLTADGTGYTMAIPVQTDKYYRKFYIKANAGTAPAAFTAVPVFEADGNTLKDRTAATADACSDSWAGHTHPLLTDDKFSLPLGSKPFQGIPPLRSPLPASGNAFWLEELTGGYTKEHTEFTSAALAKGLNARLSRPVSRFDINNPATTGFVVTGISAANVDVAQCYLFKNGGISLDNRTPYNLKTTPLTNATTIPGALYIPNGTYGSSSQLDIVIHGTFHGVETTLHATLNGIEKHTRYIVNIINSGSNVAAALSIAPWNNTGKVDSDDLFGTLNGEAHVTIYDRGGTRHVSKNNNDITILYNYSSNAIKITGKASDTKPVGISIPNNCTWLTIDKISEDVSTGTYSVWINTEGKFPEADEQYYFDVDNTDKNILYCAPPETVTLTLVTQEIVDGKNLERTHEYKVTRDWFLPDDTNLNTKLVMGTPVLPSGATHNATTRTITLPPFQVGSFYNLTQGTNGPITQEDQSWLHPRPEKGRSNSLHTAFAFDNNFQSSSPRSAKLTLRLWNNSLAKVVTEEYTVTQTAGNFDPNLLTTAVNIDNGLSGASDPPTVFANTITIPAAYAATSPLPTSGIFLVGTDEKGFIATANTGQEWLWLETPWANVYPTNTQLNGKHVRRIRTRCNTSGNDRTGYIDILYRGSDGKIAYTIITVVQKAGAGTI